MANTLDTAKAFSEMKKAGLNPLVDEDIGLFLERWDGLKNHDPDVRIAKSAQLAAQDKLPAMQQAELDRLTRGGQLPASARDYLKSGTFKPEPIKRSRHEVKDIETETNSRELLKAGLGVSKVRYQHGRKGE